jgi:hypothetical protein
MYNELIQRFESSIPPDERKTVDDAITQLKTQVGEVMIDSDQAGSSVVIDGQQQEGTTPLPAIGVNAGTHSIRVSKEGFEAYEDQVLVAGGQRKTVHAKLKALSKIGRLVVKEAAGKTLDVVVDGAVAGKTPVFQGVVAVGPHTVFLRGEGNLGTAPASVDVKENQSSSLTLSAVELDAEIRIEPTPANAKIFVDSVELGNGVWEGRLQSGAHKIEVAAEGFIAFSRDARLVKGKKELVKVVLDRDLSNPMWSAGFVPHLYFDGFAGAAIGLGFGGGADKACSNGDCSSKGLPLGFLAGARAGYQLTRGLGVDLGVGYMYLHESMTRKVTAKADNDVPFVSKDYKDETTVTGPFVALSVIYRLLDKTPLTFRVSAGAARLRATFKNGGTFSGQLTNPCDPAIDPACDNTETATVSQKVKVAELASSVWVPFVAPEARFGLQVAKKLSVDFGVAFWIMLPPPTPRTAVAGENDLLNRKPGQRRIALNDVPDAFANPPSPARPGVLDLPAENGFGTFFAIMPNLGARFDL